MHEFFRAQILNPLASVVQLRLKFVIDVVILLDCVLFLFTSFLLFVPQIVAVLYHQYVHIDCLYIKKK